METKNGLLEWNLKIILWSTLISKTITRMSLLALWLTKKIKIRIPTLKIKVHNMESAKGLR